VNRRLVDQLSILGQPEPFGHFVNVLQFGEPVETSGRGGRRTWFLGHGETPADADYEARILIGQIGWVREEALPQTHFDTSAGRWIDDLAAGSVGNHAPFLYHGDSQRLAVLMHPSFRPNTIAYVFSALLNRGEQRQAGTIAEWSAEPLLDVESFRVWLAETHAVQKVTFVAKLPNPDGMEAFEEVLERLQARKAAALTETWEARDPAEGLHDIEDDQDARQMLAMAERGYGHVRARGISESGRQKVYNQKQRVRREMTPPLPSTWGAMIGTFIDFVLSRIAEEVDE